MGRTDNPIFGGQDMALLRKIFKSEDGSTAVEYALIAMLIGISIITSLTNVQKSVSNTMTYSKNALNSDGNGE